MSGFAGIVHLDGASVDGQLVDRMTRLTERHGGDSFTVSAEQEFAFGHALLRTTPEPAYEVQPLSFDDNTWLVGDARIDARESLVATLNQLGQPASLDRPDIELVLHAFHAWGENCVDHLLGDFAFALWDRQRRRLFCARDHFGIKPFYFLRTGNTFVFSNDIAAMQLHPDVSGQLHAPSICDYLAFGYGLDENRTCFADIRRIPPGHSLRQSTGAEPRLQQYRQLNFSARIRYKNPRDYADHFLTLFRQAVADRLRTDCVVFELSGGLDSTSVAAIAADLNRGNASFSGLGITTESPQQSPGDGEAHFAKLAADACKLRHAVVQAGNQEDFYAFCGTAQPYAWPFAATTLKYAEAARTHARVLLSGQCGDVLLQGSGTRALDDFRDHSLPRFVALRLKNVFEKRSVRAFGLRTLMKRGEPLLTMPGLPEWLNPDFLEKSGSAGRWKDLFYRRDRYPRGCRAERTCDELRMPFWSHLFESYYHDLLCGVDCRHPFFDVRLVEFLASIPAVQKSDKNLLRKVMTGLLPPAVRLRQKTIVAHDLVRSALEQPESLANLDLSLESYAAWIDRQRYREALRQYAAGGDAAIFTIMCPVSLQQWQTWRQVL